MENSSIHEIVFCIVNTGFSERVMEAARSFGARGGTILHARGTVSKDAEKIFNVTIQPDKEIVMILINTKIRTAMLKGLYAAIGTDTPAQGIVFTLPVDADVGITKRKPKEGGETNEKVTNRS